MTPLLIVTLFFLHPAGAITLLDSDDFASREAGSAVLEAWGDAAIPVLRVGRGSEDRETRRRCVELLAMARCRLWERLMPFPEIDSLWYNTRDRCYAGSEFPVKAAVCHYLERAFAETHQYGYPFRSYTLATQWLMSDLIDAGVPEWALVAMLDEMRRRDAAYFSFYWSTSDWRHDCWGLPPTKPQWHLPPDH